MLTGHRPAYQLHNAKTIDEPHKFPTLTTQLSQFALKNQASKESGEFLTQLAQFCTIYTISAQFCTTASKLFQTKAELVKP